MLLQIFFVSVFALMCGNKTFAMNQPPGGSNRNPTTSPQPCSAPSNSPEPVSMYEKKLTLCKELQACLITITNFPQTMLEAWAETITFFEIINPSEQKEDFDQVINLFITDSEINSLTIPKITSIIERLKELISQEH